MPTVVGKLSIAVILLSAACTPLGGCKNTNGIRQTTKTDWMNRIDAVLARLRSRREHEHGHEYRKIWGGQMISTPSLSSRPLDSSRTI